MGVFLFIDCRRISQFSDPVATHSRTNEVEVPPPQEIEYIRGGAIFLVGGSSVETKIAEGIRDAKNRRFVLYIAFAGKIGGLQPPAPSTPQPMEYYATEKLHSPLLKSQAL